MGWGEWSLGGNRKLPKKAIIPRLGGALGPVLGGRAAAGTEEVAEGFLEKRPDRILAGWQ